MLLERERERERIEAMRGAIDLVAPTSDKFH